MQKLFIIFLNIICVSTLLAQTLPALKNVDRDSVYSLFANIEHKIEINPRKADLSQIELKAINGNVVKVNDTIYLMRYYNVDELSKIKLYYKGLPVDIMTVKIINLMAPVVKIAGNLGPNISSFSLKNLKRFELIYNTEMLKMSGLELFNCRILITEPGKPVSININLRNQEFPEQLINIISNLKPSATIRFDEFKMKTSQNMVLNVEGSSITFVVVE